MLPHQTCRNYTIHVHKHWTLQYYNSQHAVLRLDLNNEVQSAVNEGLQVQHAVKRRHLHAEITSKYLLYLLMFKKIFFF